MDRNVYAVRMGYDKVKTFSGLLGVFSSMEHAQRYVETCTKREDLLWECTPHVAKMRLDKECFIVIHSYILDKGI